MTNHTERSRLRLSVRLFAPVLLGVVVLVAWQAVTGSGTVPATLLPAPGDVLARFGADLASGSLLAYAGATIVEALLGCLFAAALALPLGYAIARAATIEAALSPYLAASQAIPAVAIAPLLVIWVGYGLVPIMVLCALLVFFPVVLATVLGLRTIDNEVLEAAQLDGASGLSMLRFIEWPLALPAVLTGLRNGFTLSVTGAVVGELVMGGEGLGMVLSVQSAAVDTVGLFATLVMLCLIAVVIYLAMIAIEWFTNPLRPVRAPAAAGDSVAEPADDAALEPEHLGRPARPEPLGRPAPVSVLRLESGVL